MSVSTRSFLIPGVALATAGVVALTPALTTAPTAAPALPAAAVPSIHIDEIQLAGIGREIYDSITNFMQYTVSSAQFWIDLIPLIGPPLAEQLGINYFLGIQPLIASTVYFASDVIDNPLNLLTLAVDYGQNVFYTGYNWVSAQLEFLGLPGLAPIPVPPPLASVFPEVSPAGRGAAAAVTAPVTPAPETSAPETDPPAVEATVAEAAAEVTVVRGRATRAGAPAPRPNRTADHAVAGAAATVAAATGQTDHADAPSQQRGSAKATRGAARTAR